MDKLFKIETLRKTSNPQQLIWLAAHQDYSENFVAEELEKAPKEKEAGELIVKHLLAGNRGHYGCFEHPQITFNVGYFPHSMMQQVRTHRVGVSFDVQCLAADTEITFLHSSGALRKFGIGDLYELWHNGEKAIRQRLIKGRKGELPGEYRRDCKKRLRKMKLRVLNEDTGVFQIGHLKDVMFSGIQPVYRVHLKDGKTLDCTVNHRLLTPTGWKTMGEALGLVTDSSSKQVLSFQRNRKVLCNGTAAVGTGVYRQKEWLEERLKEGLNVLEMAELAECSIETIKAWVYKYKLKLNKRLTGTRNPWNKNNGGYKLNLSEESRQKRREDTAKIVKRGSESHFWKGGSSNERTLIGAWTRQRAPQVHAKFDYTCQRCGIKGKPNLHAHHLVPVFADESLAYNFDNLVTLCEECHRSIHSNSEELEFAQNYKGMQRDNNWKPKAHREGKRLVAHPVEVLSVEYLGEQETYDIEVDGKWHNFVANGLVVHNSFRYTGRRIYSLGESFYKLMASNSGLFWRLDRDWLIKVEQLFYIRPEGEYTDRKGKRYSVTFQHRRTDLLACGNSAIKYYLRLEEGYSEEHARSLIPFDVRQHFVVSCNLRSLMHLLDLRWKKDAQLEAQQFCDLLFEKFEEWAPAVAQWYLENRGKKARLSP